jgi:hypothetical protein
MIITINDYRKIFAIYWQGTIGTLLNDTALTNNLNQSLINLKYETHGFNETMEAIKVTWPFKKYFKNKTKALKK